MSFLYDAGQSGLIIHANPTSPFYSQSFDASIGGSEDSKGYLGTQPCPPPRVWKRLHSKALHGPSLTQTNIRPFVMSFAVG